MTKISREYVLQLAAPRSHAIVAALLLLWQVLSWERLLVEFHPKRYRPTMMYTTIYGQTIVKMENRYMIKK
jgi:hypothetical protein